MKLAPRGNPQAYYQGQEGICYFLLGQDKEAYQSLSVAQEMFRVDEKDFDPEIYGLVYYFLGSLYEYDGDHEASLRSRLKAIKYLIGEMPHLACGSRIPIYLTSHVDKIILFAIL